MLTRLKETWYLEKLPFPFHGVNLTAYIRYRLEKAQEVYEAAKVLYNASQWNSVINRLYYACFYSASALLLFKNISAKTHAGVIGQISEKIVRYNY